MRKQILRHLFTRFFNSVICMEGASLHVVFSKAFGPPDFKMRASLCLSCCAFSIRGYGVDLRLLLLLSLLQLVILRLCSGLPKIIDTKHR